MCVGGEAVGRMQGQGQQQGQGLQKEQGQRLEQAGARIGVALPHTPPPPPALHTCPPLHIPTHPCCRPPVQTHLLYVPPQLLQRAVPVAVEV